MAECVEYECQSFLTVWLRLPHCSVTVFQCATFTKNTMYFQRVCAWFCNYLRLTSIPSNLNFMTGTNASSTALKKKHQEREMSPTDQRPTFRRSTEWISLEGNTSSMAFPQEVSISISASQSTLCIYTRHSVWLLNKYLLIMARKNKHTEF